MDVIRQLLLYSRPICINTLDQDGFGIKFSTPQFSPPDLGKPFEFMIVKQSFSQKSNPAEFADAFNGLVPNDAAVFASNTGNVLVSVAASERLPDQKFQAGGHLLGLLAYAATSDEYQKPLTAWASGAIEVMRTNEVSLTAGGMGGAFKDHACWLTTDGLSIPWLHLRIDKNARHAVSGHKGGQGIV